MISGSPFYPLAPICFPQRKTLSYPPEDRRIEQGADRSQLSYGRETTSTTAEFKVQRLDAGQYLLKREPLPDNEGVVDWLLGCPDKGWFHAVASESTDTL